MQYGCLFWDRKGYLCREGYVEFGFPFSGARNTYFLQKIREGGGNQKKLNLKKKLMIYLLSSGRGHCIVNHKLEPKVFFITFSYSLDYKLFGTF